MWKIKLHFENCVNCNIKWSVYKNTMCKKISHIKNLCSFSVSNTVAYTLWIRGSHEEGLWQPIYSGYTVKCLHSPVKMVGCCDVWAPKPTIVSLNSKQKNPILLTERAGFFFLAKSSQIKFLDWIWNFAFGKEWNPEIMLFPLSV